MQRGRKLGSTEQVSESMGLARGCAQLGPPSRKTYLGIARVRFVTKYFETISAISGG